MADPVQVPVKAYVFANGMIMVFDAAGQQVPEYQGPIYPNLINLQKAYPNVKVSQGELRR